MIKCFIGSSSEQLDVARALSSSIEDACNPVVWDQDVFDLSAFPIETIEREFPKYDFFCFVASPDDLTISRGAERGSPRDNVIFEIGLAMGVAGRQNVVLLCPSPVSEVKVPSDLFGLSLATFEPSRFEENEMAALNTAARSIRHAIKSIRENDLSRNKTSLSRYGLQQGNIFASEISRYFEKLGASFIREGVVRSDWNIITKIDPSEIEHGVLKELVTWSYTLRNVQERPVRYPFKFFDYADQALGISFSITKDSAGGEVLLEEERRDAEGGVRKREAQIDIAQGESVKFVVNYLLSHYVNPKRVHFHNSFVTSNPTDSIVMSVDLPDGYQIDVLAEDTLESNRMSDRHVFRIEGPVLPESCVEYIVWKQK